MKGFLLAFYLGIQACLLLPSLPDLWWGLLCIPVFAVSRSHVFFRFILVLLAGFFYCVFISSLKLSQALPEDFSGKQFVATGTIVGMPEPTEWGQRFVLQLNQLIDEHGQQYHYGGRVRLSWNDASQELHSGDEWLLKVKLKLPHGFANPGSFDYEFWLFHQGVHATGYVLQSQENQRLRAGKQWGLHNIRVSLNQRLRKLTKAHELSSLVKGLLTGTRAEISDTQWQVLRQTGTSHLMAISGLHIALIATGFYFMALSVGRYYPVSSSAHVLQHYALALSFIAAVIYALLAGFSLPTQRALIMLSVAYIALFTSKKFSLTDVMSVSGIIVMLYDPLAVRSAGFYLSFFAVSLILLGSVYRLRKQGAIIDAIRIQCALSLGLAPWVLFYFSSYPLLSLPANLFAVPLLSLLILPGLLLACIISFLHWDLASLLMTLILAIFELIWDVLAWMSGLTMMQWQGISISIPALLLLTLMSLLLLLPAFFQRRYLLALAGFTVFLSMQTSPQRNGLHLTVLDVGQGLSIVVQVGDYVLLYDAGPAYRHALNTGERVVVPFLIQRRIATINDFIVSHQDNDHAGGVGAVLERIPVQRLISDAAPHGSHVPMKNCKAGMQWHSNGAVFQLLHPHASYQGDRNNRSCVLKISYQGHSILLPGDIEARAERHLLNERGGMLSADILIGPHHGSASSSTPAFIQAVKPDWVIFSSGYQNRYKFPKQVIIDRYQNEAVSMLQTIDSGAISIVIHDGDIEFERYRDKYKRFWHHSLHQQNSYCGEC